MCVFWGFRGKCNERIMGNGKEFVFCGCPSVLRRIRKMIGGAILETMVSANLNTFIYLFYLLLFYFQFFNGDKGYHILVQHKLFLSQIFMF